MFLETYRKAQTTPKEKYPLPQTEAQEIGWDITPLVRQKNDADTPLTLPASSPPPPPAIRWISSDMTQDYTTPGTTLRSPSSWTHFGCRKNKKIFNSDHVRRQ